MICPWVVCLAFQPGTGAGVQPVAVLRKRVQVPGKDQRMASRVPTLA